MGHLSAALEAVHRQGIVHRDVTPRNVMLARDGKVVLGDFGIVSIAGVTGVTQSGMLVGTPGYISPERLRGEEAAPQSDL